VQIKALEELESSWKKSRRESLTSGEKEFLESIATKIKDSLDNERYNWINYGFDFWIVLMIIFCFSMQGKRVSNAIDS
jgi:hypothetical protein